MTIFYKNAIRELLSQAGFVVGDIYLDEDDYIAEVFIEVNAVGLYSPFDINMIAGKIERLETELIMKGFIHDIKVGDLVKGNWRLLIHFLDQEEIEDLERKAE